MPLQERCLEERAQLHLEDLVHLRLAQPTQAFHLELPKQALHQHLVLVPSKLQLLQQCHHLGSVLHQILQLPLHLGLVPVKQAQQLLHLVLEPLKPVHLLQRLGLVVLKQTLKHQRLGLASRKQPVLDLGLELRLYRLPPECFLARVSV